ncbi:LOW QUALITY PROTEIN: protein SSUH2 homolog [Thalassophryne amazonica]|uniref:LOW QUALITY PROTEIN: protein SSUH2 homolog n=1 Tax=Thalassophryne amazonica TaxID=390379 RepID=UPI001471F964|nr:LOW QUALITY PROTEIN: protein SSUH2 homolog [Thalassophryne amazonica]
MFVPLFFCALFFCPVLFIIWFLSGAPDPNIPEQGPTAPPPGWLDTIHGYQDHKEGEHESPLYPPPSTHQPQREHDKNTSVPNVRVHTVSEAVAREALIKFAESKWKYSSKPARELTFTDLKPITVYRYRLETFTETRTSAWHFEPYNGQQVDGPQYGPSPPPWDIPVMIPQQFADVAAKARVPHSSVVKRCHQCDGRGRTRCQNCGGHGRRICGLCHGRGRRDHGRCFTCQGRVPGYVLLVKAQASGYAAVVKAARICCISSSSLEPFKYLQRGLFFAGGTHMSDYIPDRQHDFPNEKFKTVKGDPFFINEGQLVYPIKGFPDQEICDISAKLINEHINNYSSTSRIVSQRQVIELVPMTDAHYSYSGRDYNFYVYGMENEVYAAHYPTACSIL